MLASIEEVVKRIRAKYCTREDARDKMHSHDKPESWITVNHTHVPLDDDGKLKGKVGKKISDSSPKSSGHTVTNTSKPVVLASGDIKNRLADTIKNRNVPNCEDLAERIRNGKIKLRLLRKRQNKHIAGTDEYNKAIADGLYPSELQLSRKKQMDFIVKALQNGTYVLRKDGSIRIQYDYGSKIGNACEADGSNRSDTTLGEVHLSKDGVHIVPIMEVV